MEQMTWDNTEQAYFGVTSDGKRIRVDVSKMNEAAHKSGVNVDVLARDSVISKWEDLSDTERELLDPDRWAGSIGDK
jgi:hypothetical protein